MTDRLATQLAGDSRPALGLPPRGPAAAAPPPSMIGVEWQARDVVVTIRGDLDCATAPVLSAQLTEVLARQPTRLVFDVAAVPFMDCAGVSPIMRARRCLSPACPVVIRSPGPAVRTFLAITGLNRLCELRAV